MFAIALKYGDGSTVSRCMDRSYSACTGVIHILVISCPCSMDTQSLRWLALLRQVCENIFVSL